MNNYLANFVEVYVSFNCLKSIDAVIDLLDDQAPLRK